MALIHHPVVDKNGETIASAVTNLDLHDIARAARTFGAKGFFVVTPLADQAKMVDSILSHWLEGAGAIYNPKRRRALELIRLTASHEQMVKEIREAEGMLPKVVVTSARTDSDNLSCEQLKKQLEKGKPYILALGTAWGLSKPFMDSADYVLEPVKGNGDYNHLSVRSAASIVLDRLLGHRH